MIKACMILCLRGITTYCRERKLTVIDVENAKWPKLKRVNGTADKNVDMFRSNGKIERAERNSVTVLWFEQRMEE